MQIRTAGSDRGSPLVAPDTLAGWIAEGRPDLRVIDLRWYLGQRGSGRAAYAVGHIPGAIHLDLDSDLAAAEGPGRHPLPDPAGFSARLATLGIGDDNVVVAYDDVGGWVAARLWWMLDDLGFGADGHGRVTVLDGGFPAWVGAGFPVTTETPAWSAGRLQLGSTWTRVVDRETLKSQLGRVVLLDARGGPRYRGETEPIDLLPGHIPTAIHAPADGNLDSRGRFLVGGRLRARFATLVRSTDEGDGEGGPGLVSRVVTSCGSGVSACHNALAMRIAGLPDPILYPGSYSDWSRAGEPVAVGPEPGPWPPPGATARLTSPRASV